MPSAKIESCSIAPPEKTFSRPNIVPGHLLEEAADDVPVDPGRDDDAAHPVHGQHGRREEDAATQLLDPEDVLERFDHFQTFSTRAAGGLDLRAARRR